MNIPGPTKLSFEHHDKKYTAELPWDANMDMVIETVYGLCTCMGFLPSTIIQGMAEFAEEKMEYFKEEFGEKGE